MRRGESQQQLLQAARRNGLRSIAEDAARRIVDGVTSIDEAARVVDLNRLVRSRGRAWPPPEGAPTGDAASPRRRRAGSRGADGGRRWRCLTIVPSDRNGRITAGRMPAQNERELENRLRLAGLE